MKKHLKRMAHLFMVVVLILTTLNIPVESVNAAPKKTGFNKKSTTITVGKTEVLKLSGTKVKAVKTSNKRIVTINKSLKVSAKAVGKATVTVTGTNNKKYKCTVIVKEKVSLTSNSILLAKGDKKTVVLKGVKLKSVKTSNKKIAIVSTKGLIKAIGKGNTTITYIGKNNRKYKCSVKVEDPTLVKSVTLKESTSKTLAVKGNTQKITWKSSNTSIVTVDKNGKIVAKNVGKVTITAKLTSGKLLKTVVSVNKDEQYTYTLTFNTNDGSSINNQAVCKGNKFIEPKKPVKDGYDFIGWYTDNTTFENAYDFSKVLTSNITIYAKWEEVIELENDTSLYQYKILRDGTAEITRFLGENNTDIKELRIERKIGGKKVSTIGNRAFYGCSNLTSVKIPKSVTNIGDSAFYGCSNLKDIEIPDSVTNIGDSAFGGCSNLTSVKIPKSVTNIGNSAFSGCSSLTSVKIPNSVKNIGNSAFSGCSSLTSVGISNSVTSIGGSVFYNCRNLEGVEIPDSVTNIGGYAFCNCSSLTSVKMPDSVTNIGSFAFRGCSSLTSVKMPDSVTNIGGCAFRECSSLTSVKIPDSVTNIGRYAFYNCSSLTSVKIPDSVTNIESGAFGRCSSLTSVKIPNSVTNIGDSVFEYCSSLTRIEMPDSVTNIGNSAFYRCNNYLIIYVKSGSYSEKYAKNHGYNYKIY